MTLLNNSLFGFFFLVVLLQITQCTHFLVAPFEKDCFHFKVDVNNIIVGSYEIIETNAACTISIVKRHYNKKENVFTSEKEQEKFELEALNAGIYSFCYENKKNSELTIMFTLRIKEGHHVGDSDYGTVDDVQQISNKASEFLEVFDEQERMMENADLYKQFNEKMNSKLILWSEIQIVLLILLTLIHIYFIKSFFEIKTIV
ncbi:cop-coated vesicle membrane protein p24, putative [Plasmodium malariae]|uniref:Cop-coated vesicle membrane protein p24, putative n=1 Tax=Plasmodium malariae TaxID=5858 RepID=A0A1C3L290_PLAMA|nr:cop-coated vesicle membrane protein p24, putative [Plasmodium malariae]